jgi:hypothetical protein
MVRAPVSRSHRTPRELPLGAEGRKGLCAMTEMKKSTAIAVTVAVWVAAAGSAAALAYDLNRPLSGGAASQLVVPLSAERAAVAKPAQEPERVLYIPTITIVAQAPRRPAVSSAPKPRDLSQMHCANWRELDLGSGHVQVCE